MAKTRSRPAKSSTPAPPKATLKQLGAPVSTPPQLVVLPKDASPDARIATVNSSRYFICPTKGFFEFTRISAPKSSPRSWLLAPDRTGRDEQTAKEDEEPTGYVLQSPHLLLATPIDPLFLLLPSLAADSATSATEYLAPSDYLSKMTSTNPHLSDLLPPSGLLAKILESRIEAVSDCMDMGDDEKMYALSLPKLVKELVAKARRMTAKGLPASMEEKFVKQALNVPELSIKREDTEISVCKEEVNVTVEGSTNEEEPESQESSTSATTISSVSTTLTTPDEQQDQIVPKLLRLRTALDFLLKAYIPASLRPNLESLISPSGGSSAGAEIDWTPLTLHLSKVAALKREAQALRSLSDNISRKRANVLDEDAEDREESKRRKKEEEDKAKKNVSQGVKKLAKVNVKGMQKLSSFFGKK